MFDIERRSTGHVAFGIGIHTCLARQIARLEAQSVLQSLLEKVDRLELTGEPRWWHGVRSVRAAGLHRGSGVRIDQALHHLDRALPRDAAFGRDAELRHIPARCGDAPVDGFGAVCMYQTEIDVCVRLELQFPERLEKGVVVPLE